MKKHNTQVEDDRHRAEGDLNNNHSLFCYIPCIYDRSSSSDYYISVFSLLESLHQAEERVVTMQKQLEEVTSKYKQKDSELQELKDQIEEVSLANMFVRSFCTGYFFLYIYLYLLRYSFVLGTC